MNVTHANDYLLKKATQAGFPLYAMPYLQSCFADVETMRPLDLKKAIAHEIEVMGIVVPMIEALHAGKTVIFRIEPIYKWLEEGYIGTITRLTDDLFLVERTKIYYWDYAYTDARGVQHPAIELGRERDTLRQNTAKLYQTLCIAYEYDANFEVQS